MIKMLMNIFNQYKNPIKYWKKKGLTIGDNCMVFPNASFSSEPYLISIGDKVRINTGVQFITHDGGCWVLRNMYEELADVDKYGRITVGNNVHIGNQAIIMPGVSIGDNCVIGCGAIVTHSIPDNSVAVGVPARVIETVEEYKRKNEHALLHTKKMDKKQKKAFIEKYYIEDQEMRQ